MFNSPRVVSSCDLKESSSPAHQRLQSIDLLIPVFQRFLELIHKPARIGAIDNAMVEAKAEVLNRANGNRVIAVLIGEDNRILPEPANRQDGRIGLVNDGSSKLLAEDAGIGECEGGS